MFFIIVIAVSYTHLVYDKNNDKYLTINWGENGGRLFIGGTRHDGESALECAKREIKEGSLAHMRPIRTSHPGPSSVQDAYHGRERCV